MGGFLILSINCAGQGFIVLHPLFSLNKILDKGLYWQRNCKLVVRIFTSNAWQLTDNKLKRECALHWYYYERQE
jgi:hypothetical protein